MSNYRQLEPYVSSRAAPETGAEQRAWRPGGRKCGPVVGLRLSSEISWSQQKDRKPMEAQHKLQVT
ncbi:hypothetical protein M5K25_027926 [Dendrobium thyrsiflorum]|uniref:Uncharacterized protein n=1 Tax=Dendrobium thyrsiflorum TaxID=117978 RepID=A0ABD0TV27_DENTH